MDTLKKAREGIDRIDRQMADLFLERMGYAHSIATYKKENNLPIEDVEREHAMMVRLSRTMPPSFHTYYKNFLTALISQSKNYQKQLISPAESFLVCPENGSYPVILQKGSLSRINEYFDLSRKVLILTDDGVPREYTRWILALCKEARIYYLPIGETSKCFSQLEALLEFMTSFEMERSDCLVAVGGGVVGDIGGLAASLYMRGIDCYQVPTTLLAQVDSSVGGKTAINFGGFKNSIGTFRQPKGVLIDPDTLKTLPDKQFSCGMAEIIKVFATFDKEAFEMLEAVSPVSSADNMEELIFRAITIKKAIVEQDPQERNLRKSLNFGHTIGHCIESAVELPHGECVGLGMLCITGGDVRQRLSMLLRKYKLSTSLCMNVDNLTRLLRHDKKCKNGKITAVFVDEIGCFSLREVTVEELTKGCRGVLVG